MSFKGFRMPMSRLFLKRAYHLSFICDIVRKSGADLLSVETLSITSKSGFFATIRLVMQVNNTL